MKAICTKRFFDGVQLYEENKEYEVPKGTEKFFNIPKQKPLIEDAPKEKAK